ncbi:MAG: glycoprotein [Elisy virus]|uniref:Glycoprotein n=1 Tax=Elisy virus TaxID=2800914 RepID=A0A894KJD0_9RHAB|nr:MAG: glycoprotein [Elisy virus]
MATILYFYLFFVFCLLCCGNTLSYQHCSEKLSKEIINKTRSILGTKDSKPLTGFMDRKSARYVYPLELKKPPPCGSYDANRENIDRFHKTAVQIYRFDPTLTPHLVVELTAVRVETICKSHWIGRDEKVIVREVTSTFNKLPEEDLLIFLQLVKGKIESFSLGEENLELLSQELFECPYFVNPGEKMTYALRVRVKSAYWSPSGYMVSPYFLKDCTMTAPSGSCNASTSTLLLWSPLTPRQAPLVPGAIMGGILETTPISRTNEYCPGARRFLNLRNTFQLSFQVPNIQDWTPETLVSGIPIFVSEEGIFFTFLTHDGQMILRDLCPSWKHQGGSRTLRHTMSHLRFSSEMPLPIQTSTLEDEVSWIRAETEGQLDGLFNRTVRELIDLHFQDCLQLRAITLLSIGLSPLDPKPYISSLLGHDLFEVFQIGSRRFFRTAQPVTDLVFHFENVTGHNIHVTFKRGADLEQGYFDCRFGFILSEPDLSDSPVESCYLTLHRVGGVDLCSGEVTPSSYESTVSFGDWIPKISAPSFGFSDIDFQNHLEETELSYVGPKNFLKSMGHSLVHEDSLFKTIADYTFVIDKILYWSPYLIVLFVCVKIFCCCFGQEVSKSVRSRIY